MNEHRSRARRRAARLVCVATFIVGAACLAPTRHVESAASAPPSPSGGAAPGARANPFEGARFFLDPDYAAKVESTASAAPAPQGSILRRAGAFPTGLWIDSIAQVAAVPRWLDAARAQQTGAGPGQPVVPVLVIYDLPNRDCAAKSSNGELTVENDGEGRYRREVIDPLAEHFRARGSQRIVAILEPDSLANLATNLNVPRCAASADVYRRSVAYAISKLSLPNVSLYLDAAHAGWLGWNGNRIRIARVFKEVLAAAGGADKIRGFATNVSNYNILSGSDGKKLEPSNPCPDELTYVKLLADTLRGAGIADKGFIVDTSRNGRGGIRTKWGSWCNVRGAGLGERPRASPAPLVDAYFWVKPPGDSDGVSDPGAPRFDASCTGPDAATDAPQAGKWFPAYFEQLVTHANPPL